MKYVIMSLLMVGQWALASGECQSTVSSEEITETKEIKTDVPKHLEGATITVTLKDGKSSTVPAEKFKVVPRQQQFLTTQTRLSSHKTCEEIKHHRVSLLVGKGSRDGLKRDNSEAPDLVTVENKVGAVFGAQYQYRTGIKWFKMPLSVGAQGQTNKTGSVLLGLDF